MNNTAYWKWWWMQVQKGLIPFWVYYVAQLRDSLKRKF